jgi:divalent metal cation (Fe/Co/Zn/Cd) transporter
MFGHGRAQNVAALVVATLFISFTSLLYTQKQRGAAAKAQFMESINDELGLIAALIGRPPTLTACHLKSIILRG